MNASELIAILVLMIAGGLIAYLGDWIGLTVGKRRLTVFKLRPRNTAKALTVVAGALIALVTFIILIGVNRGFSIAVQNGAQILRRNHELTKANRLLKQNADEAEAEVEQARAQAAAADLKSSAAEMNLRQVNAKLTQSQAAFLLAKQQLTAKQTQVARTESALRVATIQLANARHQGAVLALQNEKTEKSISTFLQVLQPKFNSQIENTLVYRNGEEIGRVVIQSNQPTSVIRQQIYGFLGQLSAEALRRGAARGSNGRSVVIGPIAGETANIAALADSIHDYHNDNGKVVVLAHALGNSFVGEQFGITLSPRPDELAIRQGTVLGELTIQPSEKQNPGLILSEVQRLLVQTVRPAALHAGVIPVLDPQLHEADFGKFPIADLYGVIDQARQISGAAIVTVKAANDTYAADKLELIFTVSSAPPPASASSSSG